ncbi:MAG: DUF4058 family protein [Isosphaeraceae bacterium]
MPVQDWTRVASGIFYDFHLSWTNEIRRALNAGILPNEVYALVEGTALDPQGLYRVVAVRHVTDDRVVAMIEVVSPGNKDSRRAVRGFVEKAAWLLERGVHLLVVDVHPPTGPAPAGLHAAIWEEATGKADAPGDGPLTMASYESAETLRAYVETASVGESLPEMPLYLVPGGYVTVPLETTYQRAWEAVPRRWRDVIEA